MTIKSLSYSSVSMYLQCQRLFEYRYIKKLPVPLIGAALIQGSAYHAALAATMAEKLYNGLHLSLDETLDVYGASFDQQVAKYGSDGTNIDWEDKPLSDWKNRLVPLIRLYHEHYIPDLEPKSIEVYKKVMVNGIPVSGRIDLILQNGTVIDHKTSSKTMSQFDAEKNLQVTFYAILEGRAIDFAFHMAVMTKEPKIVCVNTKRNIRDIMWTKNLIMKVWEGINSGIFPPNPTTYRCSRKFCSFTDICMDDNGTRDVKSSVDELPWDD